MNQRLSSLREKFLINDIEGVPKFQGRGSLKGFKKLLILETPSGAPLYKIKRGLFTPKLVIFNEQNEKVAIVVIKPAIGIKKIYINSELYGSYFIQGGVTAWDFSVYQGLNKSDPVVATISKKLFNYGDSYIVDIISGKESFIMALCLIVDELYYNEKNADIRV